MMQYGRALSNKLQGPTLPYSKTLWSVTKDFERTKKGEMDQLYLYIDPLKQFVKDSMRLVKKCNKPDLKGMRWLVLSGSNIRELSETTLALHFVGNLCGEEGLGKPCLFLASNVYSRFESHIMRGWES